MSRHSFDPEIAAKVGLNAAVIYQNLLFWIEKNEANGHNLKDGRYWTYNSVAAFAKLFPYLTEKQIRTAIEKLLECGLILKGNYSDDRYDRTAWYALNAPICLSGQIEVPVRENVTIAQSGKGSDLRGKSLENRYNPDINPYPAKPKADEADDADLKPIWDAYPEHRCRDRVACRRNLVSALSEATKFELTAAAQAYAAETAEFSPRTIMFLDNWLREGRWRRYVEELRECIRNKEASAKIDEEAMIEKAAHWINTGHEMCRHVIKRHALIAIERGLVSLEQAQASRVLP